MGSPGAQVFRRPQGIDVLWISGVSLGLLVLAIPFFVAMPYYGYRDIAPPLSIASILLVLTALALEVAARRANRFLLAAALAHFAGQASLLVGLWIVSGCPPYGPCGHVIFLFVLFGLGLGIAAIVLAVTGLADERFPSSSWKAST